ncbi:DUF3445 domain-containing protein [Oscillochloris sp. ZM17-4]|uniref:heme-dependent oxidative N-demethylase family protein n=1 Tax=Oscillochloris sp. ZM17-4 TaxID=2866714 RepID=UPI001C739E45|nr:DUF3445 domain-containing protein [Oscillochloris sp. ZM17-4]MBX0329607.1 DUF3445 domain-containing protein [Oscillochloris sp. ZM17-4]
MWSPFDIPVESFRMAVGARPLDAAPIFLVDARYSDDLGQKAALLAHDYSYYVKHTPESLPWQWELIEAQLPELARHYPQHFALEVAGELWTWRNRLRGEESRFALGDTAALGVAPIDWLGRQVQEDLLLLSGDADAGFPLAAGQLCFANHWCLDDKLGLPLLGIHRPVPGYAEQVGRSTDMLMARLKDGRPVWRQNWSVVASAQLDLSAKHSEEMRRRKALITAENVGTTCFFRVERQSLARLPRSGAVLFAIHSYVAPIGDLAADPGWAARFRTLLESTPPALLAYKGMTVYLPALLAYLEESSSSSARTS